MTSVQNYLTTKKKKKETAAKISLNRSYPTFYIQNPTKPKPHLSEIFNQNSKTPSKIASEPTASSPPAPIRETPIITTIIIITPHHYHHTATSGLSPVR